MENGVPLSERGNYSTAMLCMAAGLVAKLISVWMLMSTATIRQGLEHIFAGERDATWRVATGVLLGDLAWVLLAIGTGFCLITFWFRSRTVSP